MINIVRNKKIPESLKSEKIKKYLKELAEYKLDTKNNKEPTKPGTYRDTDLITAFDKNFYSKCYLTEQKYANSYAMDVEHFISQKEAPELIYEWTNLYPASHKANMMKPRKTPKGGYLDPCNTKDDVEEEVIYRLSMNGLKPIFEAKNSKNIKAVNTAKLLDLLHNGKKNNDDSNANTKELRSLIHQKYDITKDLIIAYLAATNDKVKEQYKGQLKDHLSRKFSFTMLVRSMPTVLINLNSNFFD